ncbi:unannotated protein [freshwater metagenome]|uniref:Unannotated protein n=1 Tax=freshwater metagenome TaxID=449393 RepID=A0A6J6EZU7_9ZZZZ
MAHWCLGGRNRPGIHSPGVSRGSRFRDNGPGANRYSYRSPCRPSCAQHYCSGCCGDHKLTVLRNGDCGTDFTASHWCTADVAVVFRAPARRALLPGLVWLAGCYSRPQRILAQFCPVDRGHYALCHPAGGSGFAGDISRWRSGRSHPRAGGGVRFLERYLASGQAGCDCRCFARVSLYSQRLRSCGHAPIPNTDLGYPAGLRGKL